MEVEVGRSNNKRVNLISEASQMPHGWLHGPSRSPFAKSALTCRKKDTTLGNNLFLVGFRLFPTVLFLCAVMSIKVNTSYLKYCSDG